MSKSRWVEGRSGFPVRCIEEGQGRDDMMLLVSLVSVVIVMTVHLCLQLPDEFRVPSMHKYDSGHGQGTVDRLL
jgi:hypothetical protein